MRPFYSLVAGALRRCMTALMMPQAAVHQAWAIRETTARATQTATNRPQNRFDGFHRLSRRPSSACTITAPSRSSRPVYPSRPWPWNNSMLGPEPQPGVPPRTPSSATSTLAGSHSGTPKAQHTPCPSPGGKRAQAAASPALDPKGVTGPGGARSQPASAPRPIASRAGAEESEFFRTAPPWQCTIKGVLPCTHDPRRSWRNQERSTKGSRTSGTT